MVMTAMEHMNEYGGEHREELMSMMFKYKNHVDQMFLLLQNTGNLMAIKVLYDDLSELLFSSRCRAEEELKDMKVEKEVLGETTV